MPNDLRLGKPDSKSPLRLIFCSSLGDELAVTAHFLAALQVTKLDGGQQRIWVDSHMVVRIIAVLALLAVGGVGSAQAEGPIYRLVRSQGWLWGPGYHAYTCCNCPGYGDGSIYPPSMLPYEVLPYEGPEPVVAPQRVGYLPQRYPIGNYPLMSSSPAPGTSPQPGIRPVRLPLVNWEQGLPAPMAGAESPAATAARPSLPRPAVDRQ